MMVRFIAAALVFFGTAHVAAAQSLGDVARKEEERRKTVKSSGKVYTNDKLKPAPQPSSPAPASQSEPSSTPTEPAPSDAAANARGDESAWRKRMTEARESLKRSQTFADALQNQLNSLATDFVNRDDPAQRNVIAQKRDGVMAELERVKKEIADQTKAISDIQEEARRAGVPAGWVR
jgi:predicted lipid-binding transport protein (Tim44 family)